MPGLTRRRWLTLGAAIALSGGGLSSRSRSSQAAGGIVSHASGREGFYANAYLFEGDDACLLVDAHLNESEALSLAALVQETGKPLDAIFVTHPHPDHYLGLGYLAPLFPSAGIHGSAGTLDFIRDAASGWQGFKNPLLALSEGPVTFAGRTFDCLLPPDAESVAPAVLFDPDECVLIAGDHVLNAQHHWLAEGRGQAWRSNLSDIKRRWTIDRVLPGHGEAGGTELIDVTDGYITRFLELQASGADAAEARAAMLDAYPDYVFIEALETSISAFF